jgi:hypothetical protein
LETAGTLSAQTKRIHRQLAGIEKCSIPTLSTQESLSFQKVAYQKRAFVALLPDKALGLGEIGQWIPILGHYETLPSDIDRPRGWKLGLSLRLVPNCFVFQVG